MTYIIQKKLRYLETAGRLNETKNYIQHGSITVYAHCVNVAHMSVRIAKWRKFDSCLQFFTNQIAQNVDYINAFEFFYCQIRENKCTNMG